MIGFERQIELAEIARDVMTKFKKDNYTAPTNCHIVVFLLYMPMLNCLHKCKNQFTMEVKHK